MNIETDITRMKYLKLVSAFMMKLSVQYLIIGNIKISNWATSDGTAKHIQLCCFTYKNIYVNTNARYEWRFHIHHV